MERITVELTRSQATKTTVFWIAREVGCRTETGSRGHRITGTRKQLEAVADLMFQMWKHTRRAAYARISGNVDREVAAA